MPNKDPLLFYHDEIISEADVAHHPGSICDLVEYISESDRLSLIESTIRVIFLVGIVHPSSPH